MRLNRKRKVLLLTLSLIIIAIAFASIRSPAFGHFIHKIGVKTEMKMSRWGGFEPRLAWTTHLSLTYHRLKRRGDYR